MSSKSGNKKQKLLLRKEVLLNELKDCEASIQVALNSNNSPCGYEDDSSDSEIEFTINAGISLTELKLQKFQLQTCLHATQELTGVTILQSEVNVLVNAPTFEGEAPITEDGLWREVMAECKIDLVCFSITFYTHQPSRPFAPVSFRGLHVMPIKLVHEQELARSALPTLTTPSDALELLHRYAQAHRERRAALARLADAYADALYMETAPEGGYALRCAGLLRAAWTLRNKRSPVAPFAHNMSFELEYMDETYVKTISQAHKELCDPSLNTDERTLLLAKIIDTCLDARRQMGPANMNSDVDSQRQTSDQEMDVPVTATEIMGPPKSIPKKTKPKGKENIAVTNERKRAHDVNTETNEAAAKKTKASDVNTNSKNKMDKHSGNKASVSENENIKNNNKEAVVEHDKFSKNDTDNFDKATKKTKNFLKSKDKEITKNTDVIKTKTNLISASEKGSDAVHVTRDERDNNRKNVETSDNKKVPEKAFLSKEKKQKTAASKITSNEEEPDKLNTKEDVNSKAVGAKNLKTKASVDKSEPKTKKLKPSTAVTNKNPAEQSNVHANENTTDAGAPTSKENVVNTRVAIEKTKNKYDKNDKTVTTDLQAKKTYKEFRNPNVASEKSNPQTVKKHTEPPENNVDLKTNTNTKNIPNKVSSTKSNTNSANKKTVVKSTNIPTLSERFSARHTTDTRDVAAKSNKTFIKDRQTKTDVNNEGAQIKKLPNALIATDIKSSETTKHKSDRNVLTSKSNRNNTQRTAKLNKTNAANQNNIRKHDNAAQPAERRPTHLNNNLKANSHRARKPAAAVTEVCAQRTAPADSQTNIPHRRPPVAIIKKAPKNPLRISPRKHQLRPSAALDSSRSSAQSRLTHTNIPRLLKKPY